MKNKKKPIIDTYDPVLYPILLVVCKDSTIEHINKYYSRPNGDDITEDFVGYGYCCITFAATRRSDNRKVIIVVQNRDIPKEDNIPLQDATHEGGHYVMDVFDEIGCNISPTDQEPFCYLLQWAADNIYKTLTKKSNGNKRKKQKAV